MVIAYGFGNDRNDVADVPVDFFDIRQQPVARQGSLRNIDQLGSVEVAPTTEGASCCDPSGVATHDLDELDGIHARHGFGVLGRVHGGNGDVASDTAVTW